MALWVGYQAHHTGLWRNLNYTRPRLPVLTRWSLLSGTEALADLRPPTNHGKTYSHLNQSRSRTTKDLGIHRCTWSRLEMKRTIGRPKATFSSATWGLWNHSFQPSQATLWVCMVFRLSTFGLNWLVTNLYLRLTTGRQPTSRRTSKRPTSYSVKLTSGRSQTPHLCLTIG